MQFDDFVGTGRSHAGHTQHARLGAPAFTTRLRRAWQALAVAAVLLPAAAQVQANVGVFAADRTDNIDDVVSTINTAIAGNLGTVSGHSLCGAPPPCIATPTLAELQAYSAVLVYSNYYYSDPVALGNALADYVDGGGTVVLAAFNYLDSYTPTGRFASGAYSPLIPNSYISGPAQSLILIKDLPNHPLLQGVNSFNGGSRSYRGSGTLASGATVVAHWNNSDNTPLIAVKGNVVALNFFPPSSNMRSDFWDASTDGGRMMVNALAWTMAISNPNLPAGQATVAYTSTTLTAAGGTAPITWSATGLPDGMTLSPAGVLSGTPTTAGTYTIGVSPQDSATPPHSNTQTLTLEVTPAPVAITTTTLQPGTVGASYTAPVAATGGLAPLEWTVTGLPAGLAIDSVTGEITGTPTAAGSFNITVTATDKSAPTALTASMPLTLVIAPAPIDLTVLTPAALPPATAGQAYNVSIAVQGGEAPYRFSVTAGSLPAGLALDGATGAITGTPTLAGDASFSITVDDNTVPKAASASASAKRAKGAKAAVVSVTQAFSLSVAPAAVAATPTPVPTLHHAALALLSLMAAAFGGLALRWKKTV